MNYSSSISSICCDILSHLWHHAPLTFVSNLVQYYRHHEENIIVRCNCKKIKSWLNRLVHVIIFCVFVVLKYSLKFFWNLWLVKMTLTNTLVLINHNLLIHNDFHEKSWFFTWLLGRLSWSLLWIISLNLSSLNSLLKSKC